MPLAQWTPVQRLSSKQRKGSGFTHVVEAIGLSSGMKLVGRQFYRSKTLVIKE